MFCIGGGGLVLGGMDYIYIYTISYFECLKMRYIPICGSFLKEKIMINTGIWGNPIFKIPPEENQDAMRCIPGGCFNQQDLVRWVESCVPTEYGTVWLHNCMHLLFNSGSSQDSCSDAQSLFKVQTASGVRMLFARETLSMHG